MLMQETTRHEDNAAKTGEASIPAFKLIIFC